jgi:hypothetical protein
VAKFEVPAGTEVQACHFFAIPGNPDEDVWVNRVTVAQNEGSHHMNIFRVKTVTGLSGKPGEVVTNGQCFGPSTNWADWPLIVNSQSGQVDWTLPTEVAHRFKGGELVMLQTHYVNATTQKSPIGGKVFVNFWTRKTPPANELGTLFATNQNIRVCPGDVNKTFEKKCTFPSQGVRIVGANGHFHSRGVEFGIAPVDAMGTVGTRFYTSNSWDEPPMAYGLDVAVPAGGGIGWTCSFDYLCPAGQETCGDPMQNNCITFGGMVDLQEHCNAFVYYWPKVADISCF